MSSGFAEQTARTVQAQDEDYSPLIDAARAPAQAELGIPFDLAVEQLRRAGPWAFLLASLRDPDGGRLDFGQTRFAEHASAGSMSDLYVVLLKDYGDGWKVIVSSIGPGDMVWAGWSDQYGAPGALFSGD